MDWLYKIEIDTGYVVERAKSATVKDYYHYLGYGSGQILDYKTHKIFDLDLNHIANMPSDVTSAVYCDSDGYFYCLLSNGTVSRFQATDSAGTTELRSLDSTWNVQHKWFGMYGQSSRALFIDDYICYISTSGDIISIVSASRTEGTVKKIDLIDFPKHMLDDGWLSYKDGIIYLPAYTVGLFGQRNTEGYAKIISIPLDDSGSFGTPSYVDVQITTKDIQGNEMNTKFSRMLSNFVICGNVGFLNVCGDVGITDNSHLIAYDLKNMKVIASIKSVQTHGGITVRDTGDQKTIFIVPYNPGIGLKVFTFKNDGFTEVNTGMGGQGAHASQAVRAGPEGQLIWYDDSGKVVEYTSAEKNRFFFFIETEESAMWYESYGATAADALEALGSDVVTLTQAKALATVYGKDATGWNLYYLKNDILGYQSQESDANGWKGISSLYDTRINSFHYYSITAKDTPHSSNEYTYIVGHDTRTYLFADNVGDRSITGKKLYHGAQLFTISFYDDGVEIENSKLIGAKGSKIEGSFPSVSRSGFIAQWYDMDTDKRVTELPESFIGNLKYRVEWLKLTYELTGTVETVGETVFFDLSVTAKTGESDLVDPHIILFAKYDNDFFLKSFTGGLELVDGKAMAKLGVGSDRLSYVIAYLVEGTPTTHMYSDYAVYKYTVEGTGSR